MLMQNHTHKYIYPRISLVIILTTAVLVACSSAQSPRLSKEINQGGAPAMAPQAVTDQSTSSSSTNEFASGSVKPDVQRLVIKNAQLTIIVTDPAKSQETISKMADEMGGFVVSANLSQTSLSSGLEVPQGNITIRIPAGKMNDALARIESESDRPPQNKTVSSEDITSQYTDLQSRLRNLESAEEQLRKIMENAFNTDDVLAVYNRLVEVREQIEVTKGQIQYFEQASALSSISVDLVANAAVQPIQIGGWQPVGVVKDAIQLLINTMQFLVSAVIWIVIYILPVLIALYLIFVLPLSLVWRYLRKRRAQRKTHHTNIVTPPAPPVEPV
jgi:hypothetical protein